MTTQGFNIKISKIIIVRLLHGKAIVSLRTDLPGATFPYRECLDLEFSAARESAEDYCKKHFPGVPVEVV